jgi:hypothetical protein
MEKVSKIRIGLSDYEVYDKSAHEKIEQLGGGGISGTSDKEYDPSHNSGLGKKTLTLKDGSNALD